MKTYSEMLENILPSRTHPEYQLWKDYNINAIHRGLKVARYVSDYTPLQGKMALDLGCGTGGISIAFAKAGAHVIGIDLNPDLYRLALARSREENVSPDILRADGQTLPFKDGAFDVVICNEVIEHVPDPVRLSQEISRVLKEDGILYMSSPNKFSLTEIFKDGHYGLFGVTLLPRRLAEIYVTKVRKKEEKYTVGYIPDYYHLTKTFCKNGIKLRIITYSVFLESVQRPENRERHKYLFGLLQAIDPKRLFDALNRLPAFAPWFIFIGHKRDMPMTGIGGSGPGSR